LTSVMRLPIINL